MEAKPVHPSQTRTLPLVSRLSKSIGAKASANGRQPLKLSPLSIRPLLARMTSRGQPLEAHTLRCSTSTISYSPRQAPEVFEELNQRTNGAVRSKKNLMERLGLSDLPREVNRPNPSDVNSMSHSMLEKSRRKSRLPLYRRISNAPVLWSRTTPPISDTPSGLCNLPDHFPLSPNPSGSTSFQEQRSTLTPFSPGSSPLLQMTRSPLRSGTSIYPSEVANRPSLSKLTETGLLPGTRPHSPSSAPSHTVPARRDSTLSTSFSFSEPFRFRTGKSLTLTKPYAATSGKSSTSSCPSSVGSGTSKPATYKMMEQATVVTPLKRKRSPDRTAGPTKLADSGTAVSAIDELLSADTDTCVPTVGRNTLERNV
jgi:hypothetical protein